MLKSRGRPSFVCWSCLARGAHGKLPLKHRRPLLLLPTTSQQSPSRSFASVPNHHAGGLRNVFKESKTRTRLRQWEAQNPQENDVDPLDVDTGAESNYLTSPSALHKATIDPSAGAEFPGFAGGASGVGWDNAGFGEDQALSAGIQPGDLLEVVTESRRTQLLAVCVGRVNGIDHFYASNGMWFVAEKQICTDFALPGFASQREIGPIFDALPSPVLEHSPEDLQRELKANELRELGPLREVAAPLLAKMHAFSARADAIRQKYATQLSGVYEAATDDGREFVTASDVADLVLPQSRSKREPAAIYAVYTTLRDFNIQFYRVSTATRVARSCIFGVTPPDNVRIVEQVKTMIRAFQADGDRLEPDGFYTPGMKKCRLGRFILRARQKIDESRESRGDPAPHGILAPARPTPEGAAKAKPWIQDEDRDMMRFMHLWAADVGFSRGNQVHSFGSAILRALDRYSHVDALDRSTAWTFLQEVGWILPWDIAVRHTRPAPGVQPSRGGGYMGQPPPMSAAELDADCCPSGTRKDWFGARVFCIDAADAVDIDDGVSVEPAKGDEAGHYWIHVHVADPTSAIGPDSPAAKYAERLAETSYLPGHLERMFPDEGVRERFSLGPGRRCLTFSAKIDEADPGTLLDYTVTAGILGPRVVYITAENASAVGRASDSADSTAATKDDNANQQSPQRETLIVGSSLAADGSGPQFPPSRHMSTADELSAQEREDLSLLQRLAEGVAKAHEALGALPRFRDGVSVVADFQDAHVLGQAADGTLATAGQPSLKIAYSPNQTVNLVTSPMKLACVVAGRWCADRGVPVPYRTMPQAELNRDLLVPFVRDVFYPQIARGEEPPFEQYNHFRMLLGAAETSLEPGPYFLTGVDTYAKATSPLRRYGDLIVHWQIHAALAEEARTGRSLVVATSAATSTTPTTEKSKDKKSKEDEKNKVDDDDKTPFLPFYRAKLENEVLPLLRHREAAVHGALRNTGTREYALQALARALRFGEATLPKTFRFVVRWAFPRRNVRGTLADFFEVSAYISPDAFVGLPWTISDVRAGDELEVEIERVEPYFQCVGVVPVGRIEKKKKKVEGKVEGVEGVEGVERIKKAEADGV